MKSLMQLSYGLLVALIAGLAFSFATDVNPFLSVGGAVALSVIKTVYFPAEAGIAQGGLLTELWTGELIKKFRPEAGFLSRIKSHDAWVDKDKIHLVGVGAAPNILVNNTAYPIATATREDGDIEISLDKFDSENTRIPDDELYALPYDKRASVIEQHREELEEEVGKRAIYNLCVASNTADTPVVVTTGTSSTASGYARKRMRKEDIAKLAFHLDNLKVPSKNRELVLCPLHVLDLQEQDTSFEKAWIALKSGEVLDMYGFMISKFTANPVFDKTTVTKKAYGALPDPENELAVSVAYYNKRAAKAKGSVKMYMSEAKGDPKNRETVVGFALRQICIPKKDIGFGAIVSGV